MECRDSDRLAEEAGFWDARLRAPNCNDAERERFAAWRDQDPLHRAEFERLQLIAVTARQEVSRADVRALRDAARRAGSSHRWMTPIAVAAALGTVAVGVGFFVNHSQFAFSEPVRSLMTLTMHHDPAQTDERYETQLGQRSTVTLRDGSTVELNSKTIVKVAFTPQQRSVELVCGQALFHVAKSPQRPFIVRAGDREILAVGTEFDVRRDSSSVRVTLIEGRVAVSRESFSDPSGAVDLRQVLADELVAKAHSQREASSSPRVRALASVERSTNTAQPREVFLEPGEQFIAQGSSGEAVVQSVDIQKVIGWRDGRITLDDSTLADAVAEMNRHSLMQIRLESPQLSGLRVSGVFRAGEQEVFVAALENYFPIAAQRHGDAEIVLSERAAR